jgi:hypothetical protein
MQVEDALPRAGATIDRQPKVRTPVATRDVCGDPHQVTDERVVFGRQIGERGDVLAGNYQNVRRRRGIDVAKRDGVIVLVYAIRPCLAGSDSAEEAVGHGAA